MFFKDKYNLEYECDFDFKGCNTLILSGGAYKCIYFLGALDRIKKLDYLKNLNNLKYFGGTSSGALITTLIALGCSPYELFSKILEERCENVTSLLDVAIDFVKEKFTERSMDENITFKEFEMVTGKQLAFVVSNISKLREEIFCMQTHPDTPVITGIRLSCSLPILFPVAKYNNSIYTDGIFFDNFPLKLAKLFPKSYKVLCITTLTSHYDRRMKEFYNNTKTFKIILLPDHIRKYICVTKENKYIMYVTGYNYVNKYIIKEKKLKRRNSF